jgi:Phage integrase, N-terminal SAM-like domain
MVRLRDRMAEDLRLRGRAAITIRTYVRWARRLSEFYGVSPAKLGEGEVRGKRSAKRILS